MNNNRLDYKKNDVSTREIPWKIYTRIMKNYNGKNYSSLRIRLGIFFLAVTRARISQILVLKVDCLCSLEEKFLITIGNQTLFIQNPKIRDLILEREPDFHSIREMKSKNDFIFTSNSNGKTMLRRESFTRLINEAIQSTGKRCKPPLYLTSKIFRKWEENV